MCHNGTYWCRGSYLSTYCPHIHVSDEILFKLVVLARLLCLAPACHDKTSYCRYGHVVAWLLRTLTVDVGCVSSPCVIVFITTMFPAFFWEKFCGSKKTVLLDVRRPIVREIREDSPRKKDEEPFWCTTAVVPRRAGDLNKATMEAWCGNRNPQHCYHAAACGRAWRWRYLMYEFICECA